MNKVTGAGVIACMLFASGAQAVTDIDGQNGGALVPWALLSSGPTVAISHLGTQNLGIDGVAINTSFADRVEVSYAHNTLAVTGLGPAGADAVDNFGLKVKLNDMGDSMPQFAIGVVNKQLSGGLANTLSQSYGISTSSTDAYVAASKIVNIGGKNVLLNGVLLATQANQMGLLGFGGGTAAGANTGYSIEPEASVEVFAAENVVVGAEYRAQPSNGATAAPYGTTLHQNAAYDLHIAYIANKNLTWSAGYASLGQVDPQALGSYNQHGMFLQAQASF